MYKKKTSKNKDYKSLFGEITKQEDGMLINICMYDTWDKIRVSTVSIYN